MARTVTALVIAMSGAIVWAQQDGTTNVCDPGNGGLTLPTGFCASVVADNLGSARHLAVSPRGDLYVMLRRAAQEGGPGVIALRDGDGDGRFEQQERFGPGLTGTEIAWRNDALYIGADTRLVRYTMT